jgi:hypothetical protein
MFISYKYKQYLGRKDSKHTWEYELTDSEFGTVSGAAEMNCILYPVIMGVAIIQEYSKRNLNIAANLVMAFVWFNKLYPNWSIREMIDDNKKYNPLFPPYEKDLQKYLVLL